MSFHTYQRNIKYIVQISIYTSSNTPLLNKKQAEKEVEVLKEICLCTGKKKGHDPQNIIYKHIKAINITQETVHEVNYVEDIFRGASYFEEVLDRIPNELSKQKLHKDEYANNILVTK